jgi:hypothetical protein
MDALTNKKTVCGSLMSWQLAVQRTKATRKHTDKMNRRLVMARLVAWKCTVRRRVTWRGIASRVAQVSGRVCMKVWRQITAASNAVQGSTNRRLHACVASWAAYSSKQSALKDAGVHCMLGLMAMNARKTFVVWRLAACASRSHTAAATTVTMHIDTKLTRTAWASWQRLGMPIKSVFDVARVKCPTLMHVHS